MASSTDIAIQTIQNSLEKEERRLRRDEKKEEGEGIEGWYTGGL